MSDALMDRGNRAYDAYAMASGGRSLVSGQSLPEWKDLPDAIKVAWGAASDAAGLQGVEDDKKHPTPGKVRIVSDGTAWGTRVHGLENAKVVGVEVLPFGVDDLVRARITILEPELDMIADDADPVVPVNGIPTGVLAALPRPVIDELHAAQTPATEVPPIELGTLQRLRVRRGDVFILTMPAGADPLTARQHEQIKTTLRENGLRCPILVFEGGINVAVVNQTDLPLPPMSSSDGSAAP